MTKQRNGPPEIAAEDAEVFRAAVRDVKPLDHGPSPLQASAPRPRRRKTQVAAQDPLAIDELMPLIESAALADVGLERALENPVTASGTLSFQRAGVQTQVARRLRRGLYPIEGELDLHGLSQVHARERLAQFIVASRDAGRRCVRIIHGKGYRSGARGPILKIAVNLWLRRHLDVIAFESAKAIDGGTGAVYVLLRA